MVVLEQELVDCQESCPVASVGVDQEREGAKRMLVSLVAVVEGRQQEHQDWNVFLETCVRPNSYLSVPGRGRSEGLQQEGWGDEEPFGGSWQKKSQIKILPLVPAPHLLEQSLPQKGTFFVSPLDSESFLDDARNWLIICSTDEFTSLWGLVDILENITQVKKH